MNPRREIWNKPYRDATHDEILKAMDSCDGSKNKRTIRRMACTIDKLRFELLRIQSAVAMDVIKKECL